MNEAIFLDASFWISFRDPNDSKFKTARAIAAKLARSRPVFITTLLVAAETHAYFARHKRLRAEILRDIEENPLFRFEQVTPEDEKGALQLLHAREDKSYSLCDAISFTIMKRLNIKRALTLDDHFSQIGLFEVIDDPELI
jgi:uncharacterized protein